MKKAAKLFLYFLLALLIIPFAIIGYFYTKQDWIKNKTVEQLNLYLNAKASVGEIGFSVFSHFPHASVVFNDVTINASKNCKDATAPLFLKSKFIYIDFNWYNIFEENSVIKKVYFENGSINIWEKNGQENYQVFKKSEGGEKLSLEKVSIKNFLVNVTIPDNKLALAIEDATLKGDFYKETYNLSVACSGDFLKSELLGFVKTESKRFWCKGNLTSEKNKKFSSDNLNLTIGKLKLKANGYLELLKEKQIAMDVNLSTNKATLSELNSLVTLLKSSTNNLVQKGEVKLNLKVFGNTLSEKGIELKGNLDFEDGLVEQQKIFVKDIKCKGDFIFFVNTKEWSFTNLNFSGNANVGSFKGNGSMQGKENDFNSRLKISGNHSLESASLLFEIPYINHPKGDIRYNVVAEISELNKKRNVKLEGDIDAKNINAELRNGMPISVQEVLIDFSSADFSIQAKNIICENNDATAIINIKSNTEFSVFEATGNINSKAINTESLEKIIEFFNEGNSSSNKSISANLKVDVANIKREKLVATNFSSTLLLNENKIIASGITMKTNGGTADGTISITTKAPTSVSGIFNVEDIAISNLFYSLNNFDQDIITDKNISGRLSGKGKFSFSLNKNNAVDENSVLTETDVVIKNGVIKDFSPLFSLSKFIELEELREIKFSEIKNSIQINNRKIVIPKMDVSTSVLNFKMEGIHSFDNEIDYHFELFLKELLAKKWKAKQKKNNDSEFGFVVEEENKGSKLFVSMKGNVNNPKISYDKVAGRQEIKNKVKEEGKTIKNLFKKEFNKNYRDSANQPKNKINHFEKNYFTLEEEAKEEKKTKVKETERIIPIDAEKKQQKSTDKKKKERKLDKLFKEKENKKVETTDDF